MSGVQWVVDACTLVFAALILPAGALGNRSGHKRLLMAGFSVFTLTSAACGLVPAIGSARCFRCRCSACARSAPPPAPGCWSTGRMLPARGTRAVAWAGALLMGAGCLAMLGLLPARADPLVPALIAGLSLTGFGIGLVVTAITSALLGSVAPAQSGIASGAFTAFRQTGSVLGVALPAPSSPASPVRRP